MPELSRIAESLKSFGGDPQKAGPLAAVLGFQPVPSPIDLLSGPVTPLSAFFKSRTDGFGVLGLYRVGGIAADPGAAGLYVAHVTNWVMRPHERDRARRRLARALVEQGQDNRSIFIMVPDGVRREAEFVLPRVGGDGKGQGPVSTVRALVDLMEPTRFHRELLAELSVRPGAALRELSEAWRKAFSVERVTKAFYQEYADVRDLVAEALRKSNLAHPRVSTMADDQCRAWATRQMGRMLFLWFLQAKRWLGYDGTGQGSATYLLDLWARRDQAVGGYYGGLLKLIFFEGMAKRRHDREIAQLLARLPGALPYLNGGLFRRNQLEDDVEEAGPVTLPDGVFDPEGEKTVLGLLSRYRFTTRESTPDDQSVDPDPELLGRVFENLYQSDERHDTGTYYTPREVVHYMCRQALDGYLRDTAGAPQETLDRLRKVADEPVEDGWSPGPEVEEKLIEALENVRVCDPAVGSGAFLVGAMHEIVHLRRGLMHARGAYIEREEDEVAKWKRRAIQWSLYGVDKNPEAVDICQLRLWLSLVLDHDDPRTFDPLPNLDFRVVAGDSLVDRVAGMTFDGSLPRQEAYKAPLDLMGKVGYEQRRIEQWKRQFEATEGDPSRLKELRDNIANAQNRIIRFQLEAELVRANEEAQYHSGVTNAKKAAQVQARVKQLEQHLAALTPNAPYQKPFLWPVAFFEVFEPPSSGFDIVLANPPYVRMERLENEDELTYQDSFPEVKASRADVLVYFYGRAIQTLRDGGWLSFITSNKYMRAAYGQGLRGKLASALSLQRVIDFGDLPLFETGDKPVAAYPAVLVGCKRGHSTGRGTLQVADLTIPIRNLLAKRGLAENHEDVRLALEDLELLLLGAGHPGYPQVLLKREGWILEAPVLVRLFERLMSRGTSLGEYVKGRMYMGVKTGLNRAFVIDQATRDELVRADPKSAEITRPWLEGKDIRRWRTDWRGLYIIFANRGIRIERYPAVLEHLRGFKSLLERRATARLHPWYELQQPQEGIYAGFSLPKAIWPQMSPPDAMQFAFDTQGFFVNQKTFIIPGVEPWLVGFINSNVMHWIAEKLCTKLQNGWLELNAKAVVGRFPITEPDMSTKDQMARLACSGGDEKTLNDIVYSALGVTPSERELLEQWVERQTAANSREAIEDEDD